MSYSVESTAPAVNPSAAATRYRVKLRNFLPIIFCVLIASVSFLIIFITQRSATSSIEALAGEVMTRVSQRVVERTSAYLQSAAQAVRMNATSWQRSATVSEQEEQQFLQFFNRTSREQLQMFPYFGLVYYGDQQGNHWLNKREHDGTIHVRLIQRKEDSPGSRQALEKWGRHPKATEAERQAIAEGLAPYLETWWYEQDKQGQLQRSEQDPIKVYDPRSRPWYVGAKSQNKLFWTDVYAWEEKYQGVVSRQAGITVSAPVVRQDGQLAGVCGIDISLQAVSLFLRDLEIMKSGRAFILNGKGETVGLPNYAEVLEKSSSSDDTVALNQIQKISDSAIVASFATVRKALSSTGQQPFVLTKEQLITFTAEDKQYYGFYKPFATELGLNWTVGVIIPEDDFLGAIKQEMRRSLWIACASIGVMIIAGVLIARLITNPLTHLGKEVERIMQLDLAPTPSLVTRFVEFSMISRAFTRMKLALADVVNTISVHTKTLDWSAEEFGNAAMTLEDAAQSMQSDLQAIEQQLQQLPTDLPGREEIIQAMQQVESDVQRMQQLSHPMIERVEEMNHIVHALRQTLQVVRI
ncbi:methyl-accepting chemotaxis protein [Candidatus Magnetaquicoccus inordinatus]|uniref:methyl-accepting chemotaxis protein n=1 Tax=Candidatus Magnetaquicoccus inordinatus TaxID=2496818 RepID=UPI00102C8174|nr:methyl-accepting chemotaxis protein [Candidatus Magnetaquicoccus inordinatus]